MDPVWKDRILYGIELFVQLSPALAIIGAAWIGKIASYQWSPARRRLLRLNQAEEIELKKLVFHFRRLFNLTDKIIFYLHFSSSPWKSNQNGIDIVKEISVYQDALRSYNDCFETIDTTPFPKHKIDAFDSLLTTLNLLDIELTSIKFDYNDAVIDWNDSRNRDEFCNSMVVAKGLTKQLSTRLMTASRCFALIDNLEKRNFLERLRYQFFRFVKIVRVKLSSRLR